MTKVKICGITNLEDALLSVKFGADALGFNFYEKSPRYIAPEKARLICAELPQEVLKVGVFVNHELDKILEIAELVSLDAIQLHGDETPEFVRRAKEGFSGEIIKAVRVSENFKPEDVLQFKADAILLDAFSTKEYGGTGETFDWEMAKRVQKIFPKMYLAGGLSVENITEAINKVKPFAVDACSCLESEKGKKNLQEVQVFIHAIKSGINAQLITFREFVKKYFCFLETDYNFNLNKIDANFNYCAIRYESNKVWVEPWYFLSQYDCGVSFGLLNETQSFTIGDLVSLGYEWDLSKSVTFEKLSRTEIIKLNVSGFAEFLQKNGGECLNGNPEFYQQLKESREKLSRIYTQKIETEYLKKQAEIAWQKRDYVQVVRNYRLIKERLSPTERKRLEYCEKHSDDN